MNEPATYRCCFPVLAMTAALAFASVMPAAAAEPQYVNPANDPRKQ